MPPGTTLVGILRLWRTGSASQMYYNQYIQSRLERHPRYPGLRASLGPDHRLLQNEDVEIKENKTHISLFDWSGVSHR